MKTKLTNAVIKALPITEQSYSVRDSECRGLVVRVYPSGSKHFGVVLKVKGKVKRQSIGSCDIWGVPAARKVARDIARDIEQAKHSPEDITMEELYNLHLKLKPLQPSTLRCYRGYWGEIPEEIKQSSPLDISRRAIRDWHAEKSIHTLYLANRCVALLKACLTTGVQEGYLESNPLLGFSMGGESVNENFPTREELPGIVKKILKQKHIAAKVPLITMFTGCRISTVLQLRWDGIDGDTWTTPPTKNKQCYTITFHPYILEQINSIPKVGEWVFASDAGGHLRDIKHIITKDTLGYAPRSMKKVFASIAAEATSNLATLKTICQHKRTKDITLDVYARSDARKIREAYLKVGDLLESEINRKK